jgi:hypothetical protein
MSRSELITSIINSTPTDGPNHTPEEMDKLHVRLCTTCLLDKSKASTHCKVSSESYEPSLKKLITSIAII